MEHTDDDHSALRNGGPLLGDDNPTKINTGVAPSIVCNLLGIVPQEPVLSPHGYIFEKRAIETYLESTGKFCPVTREALKKEDLVAIKSERAQVPEAPHPHSIPNLVQLLRNDLDSILLENFCIRKENKSLKQELSTTLYTEDAAIRLMVNQQREIDELKQRNQSLVEEMQNLGPKAFTANGAMVSGSMGNGVQKSIPNYPSKDFLREMQELETKFRAARREKKNKQFIEYEKFDPVAAVPLHSTTVKGIRCLALHPELEDMLVTGGVDGTVVVFHKQKKSMVDQLKIQLKDAKPITAVATYNDFIVAGGLDGSIGIWRANNKEWERGFVKTNSYRFHRREITNVTFHPCTSDDVGPYFLASSKDKSWSIVDANSGELVAHRKQLPSEVTASSYHPGGGLLALGRADGALEIQPVNDPDAVNEEDETSDGVNSIPGTMSLPADEQDPNRTGRGIISCCQFNPNCTSLAAATSSGAVQIWDLRKSNLLQTLEFNENTVQKIRYDKTGKYLLICSESAVHIYAQESKEAGFVHKRTLSDHKDEVMDAWFGPDVIASVSMDRHLRLYENVDL
ncbi:unnamed protein product [Amoebophrya sp. A120]|nr:unnamed protein product [Amoebophrya sp. A120]|eukprot:GSA120T00014925001.1